MYRVYVGTNTFLYARAQMSGSMHLWIRLLGRACAIFFFFQWEARQIRQTKSFHGVEMKEKSP